MYGIYLHYHGYLILLKVKKNITYTENLEAFDNLDIDTSLGNVNVINGTSF